MAETERKNCLGNTSDGWFDVVVDAVPVKFKYTVWYPWFLSIVFWLAIIKCTWLAVQSTRYVGRVFRCKFTDEFFKTDWLNTNYNYANTYKQNDEFDRKMKQEFRGTDTSNATTTVEFRRPKFCEITLEEIPFEDDGH